MLPSKKRRTSVTELPQYQDSLEEEDLDLASAIKPESDQVKDLGSVSLAWSQSHGSVAGLEVEPVQDAGNQLSVEDASLSSRVFTQDTNATVLEAVNVAISKGITLPFLESSQPRNIHVDKEKLHATGSKRGKKMTLRPKPDIQEDRGDHLIPREPFLGEPSEEVKEEGGKLCTVFLCFSCQRFRIVFGFATALLSVPLQNLVFLKGDLDLAWIWNYRVPNVSSGLYEWVEVFFSPPIP